MASEGARRSAEARASAGGPKPQPPEPRRPAPLWLYALAALFGWLSLILELTDDTPTGGFSIVLRVVGALGFTVLAVMQFWSRRVRA